MNTRFYLLLERLQKLDARLTLARSPLETALLRSRKRTLRDRLARMMQRSTLQQA